MVKAIDSKIRPLPEWQVSSGFAAREDPPLEGGLALKSVGG